MTLVLTLALLILLLVASIDGALAFSGH